MEASGAVAIEPGHAARPGVYSGGLMSWVTTVDHKRIGIMYAVSACFFFLVGGLEALLIRLQLGSPELENPPSRQEPPHLWQDESPFKTSRVE